MKSLFCLPALFCQLALFAQSGADTLPPVEIVNSHYFSLYSKGLETTYYIRVLLPDGYATSEKKYPVLYLLDGDHAFAMTSDIVTYMQYGGHIPDLIVVSPAYNDKMGPGDGGVNQRRRDFSPFRWDGFPSNPSADKYFDFFKDTLIAQIESRYRVKPGDRALWGYSRSGLFVLWTLLERPGTFNRYICLDTGFHKFDDIEAQYYKSNDTLDASLFIGYGSLGNSRRDLHFIETLAQRGYKKFRFEYTSLQGEKHLMIPATGLALGLEFVYKN